MTKTVTALIVAAMAMNLTTEGEPSPSPPPPATVAARGPLVTTPERPVREVRTEDGRLFLDFGTATFGWMRLELAEPHAGMTLRVRLGEKNATNDTVDTAPGAAVVYQEIPVAIAANARQADAIPTWQATYPRWIPAPDGEREVAPFRYAEIHGLPAGVRPTRVVRMSRSVPFDDEAAAFDCSDPALTEVWNLCKHTIKATSFAGLYVDGNRERVPYEADAYLNQLCHYAVDAHYATGRLTWEHLLDNPTWPTEWRQHVPLMAWADWLYSGDDASIRRNYERIRERLMLERRQGDGLFMGWLKGVPRDIVDWPKGERDGYDMRYEIKTVTTAFHARSLEAMAAIARGVGRDDEAARFAAMRDTTAQALHEKLFDARRGCYVDGLDPAGGKASSHASLHANMLPLAFGLVPPNERERVATFVAGRGMACSVYGAQYLLDALFDAGKDDHALELLTSTGDRGWLHMSRDVGSTVTLEAWDVAYKPNLDWNHAWGAVPANMIPRKLMGIEPLEPGFARVRIRPRMGSLTWATVKHPSPRGPITAAVSSRDGSWEATVSLPAGVIGEVHVPSTAPGRIRVARDGLADMPETIRIEDGRSVLRATPGTTVFTVARPVIAGDMTHSGDGT